MVIISGVPIFRIFTVASISESIGFLGMAGKAMRVEMYNNYDLSSYIRPFCFLAGLTPTYN